MGENFHWGHTCPGAMSTSESVSRPETIPTSSPIIHTVDEEFNIKNDFWASILKFQNCHTCKNIRGKIVLAFSFFIIISWWGRPHFSPLCEQWILKLISKSMAISSFCNTALALHKLHGVENFNFLNEPFNCIPRSHFSFYFYYCTPVM